MDLIEYNIQESSLGCILLVARNGRLFRLDIMAGEFSRIKKEVAVAYPGSFESEKPFGDLLRDLNRYFKGEKVKFHVEMDFSGLRPFTLKVLKELMNIPYGELRSYGWIGKQLGYPNASRAVGQAVGRNPFPIIIPCHRIIMENGTIGGFSSGISIKEKLLSIEGSLSRHSREPSCLT